MKAYKATYNFKCRNQEYRVGKTYTSDKMKICKYGIHFCPKMEDVLLYYTPNDDFILLEIEVLGNRYFGDDKGVTDKIKVLRVVPFEEYPERMKKQFPVYEYDSNGNRISETDPNGNVCRYEYDSNGNICSKTFTNGYIIRYEYDSSGNMISETLSNGDRISETFPNGYLIHYEYDSNGNKISKTFTNGEIIRYEYDSNGNKIFETLPDGYVIRFEVAIITESDN